MGLKCVGAWERRFDCYFDVGFLVSVNIAFSFSGCEIRWVLIVLGDENVATGVRLARYTKLFSSNFSNTSFHIPLSRYTFQISYLLHQITSHDSSWMFLTCTYGRTGI